MTTRIAVIGSGGQLGHDCMAVLGAEAEVVGLDVPDIDIRSAASVVGCLGDFEPDTIVNCAAYTNVDACETDEETAFAVNATGPRNLARFAEDHGAWLIHVSTDYVFDGQRRVPEPYTEDDEPAPRSAYGRTKLAGERAIVEETARFSILRTAWLYGANGNNFPKTILKLALKPDASLRVVNDQHGCPTWSHRLARQIAAVVTHRPPGILHATGKGHCTWFEFAQCFLERLGVSCKLQPCTTDEFPRPAPRPANSILANTRLNAAGINVMAPWEQDLAAFVDAHGEELLGDATGRSESVQG